MCKIIMCIHVVFESLDSESFVKVVCIAIYLVRDKYARVKLLCVFRLCLNC